MMKFGCNSTYWKNNWSLTTDEYIEMINRLADIGFDVIEISADHLYHMSDVEISRMKAEGIKRNMEFSTNSGPAREYDLASSREEVRKNGICYFNKIFENMSKLGSKVLVGAIYSFWPADYSEMDKDAAWERSIACLQELSKTADRYDITIALEVLNRNETYILTDCEEAIEYVKRVGGDRVKILLDTYHMNIEEDNMYDAIRKADHLLAHVHVGECNRKLPGMNNSIDWPEFGKALRDINYDHYVVMEPFMLQGGEIGRDCRVFRDLSRGADEEKMTGLITASLKYLKKCCLGDQ